MNTLNMKVPNAHTSKKGLLALVLLLATIFPCVSQAQFLKQLVNTVKQTTQNRANDKASSTTNKALNSVDSATQIKSSGGGGTTGLSSGGASTGGSSTASSSSGGSLPGGASSGLFDTTGTHSVLGAFIKAAAANPNDTSGADLTMKALGMMVGGGGVSAADSAAAIKSFETGSGGSGIFYQYLTTLTSKKNGASRDTTSLYLANSGNARSEMRISIPGGGSTGKLTILARAGQPKYSLSLDQNAKTYSLNVIDTSLINAARETYQVTRIGNETVQGFSCIHARLVSTSGSGMFKSSTTTDIWTSTDVPGYSLLKKIETAQNVRPAMIQALEKAGCDGFMVKMEAPDKDYSMTMQVIATEQKTFPDSYFTIPAGYTRSDRNIMFQMMSGMSSAPKK